MKRGAYLLVFLLAVALVLTTVQLTGKAVSRIEISNNSENAVLSAEEQNCVQSCVFVACREDNSCKSKNSAECLNKCRVKEINNTVPD